MTRDLFPTIAPTAPPRKTTLCCHLFGPPEPALEAAGATCRDCDSFVRVAISQPGFALCAQLWFGEYGTHEIRGTDPACGEFELSRKAHERLAQRVADRNCGGRVERVKDGVP